MMMDITEEDSKDDLRTKASLIDPNLFVNILMSFGERFKLCMVNWDQIIAYTYTYEDQLINKSTREDTRIFYIKSLRNTLYKEKHSFLARAFGEMEKWFWMISKEQALRFNAKRIGELSNMVSECYFYANRFSTRFPFTRLLDCIDILIDNFLLSNLKSNIEVISKIVAVNSFELKSVDKAAIESQILNILKNVNFSEVKNEIFSIDKND